MASPTATPTHQEVVAQIRFALTLPTWPVDSQTEYVKQYLLTYPAYATIITDVLIANGRGDMVRNLNLVVGDQVRSANNPSFLSTWGLPIALAAGGLVFFLWFTNRKKR